MCLFVCVYMYRRKRTSLMLSKHTQLLELLEIPQVSIKEGRRRLDEWRGRGGGRGWEREGRGRGGR